MEADDNPKAPSKLRDLAKELQSRLVETLRDPEALATLEALEEAADQRVQATIEQLRAEGKAPPSAHDAVSQMAPAQCEWHPVRAQGHFPEENRSIL